MIRDEQGRYLPATAEQILDAARKVINQKVQRGAAFTSSGLVKDYLVAKRGGFEHEVFAALFLDAKHRLIQYVEMFRGSIDSASVYPREVVKEALRLNAAAVIFAHNHTSGNPEPSQGAIGQPDAGLLRMRAGHELTPHARRQETKAAMRAGVVREAKRADHELHRL